MHCAGFPAAPFTTIVIVEGGWIIVIGKLATETRAGNVGLVHVMFLGICYIPSYSSDPLRLIVSGLLLLP